MEKIILIVDDDTVIHETLSLYLTKEGYTVHSAYNGKEALEKFSQIHPTLIVLDVMMPYLNGTEVCREIRKISQVPIIMLTAKSEEIDKIVGLELGADDYMTKPFSMRELVARINTVLRRFSDSPLFNPPSEKQKQPFPNKDFSLSFENNSIFLFGKEIMLTTKEFEILNFFSKNIGKVITREDLLQEVWGANFQGDARMIDAHIKNIRQKIYVENAKWLITSVYRVGYKFEVIE